MLGTYLRRLATIRTVRTVRTVHSCTVRRFPRRVPTPEVDSKVTAPSSASKYKVFHDADATVVRDTVEEPAVPMEMDLEEDFDEFEGLNTKRGKTGVFDVEDLVATLKRENAKNIFVCRVPPEQTFVSHICVVSGRSARHMLAIAEFIKKLYKKKRSSGDPIPRIEGKTSLEWMALDLGNIALHIFNGNLRNVYDIEQLWSVGAKFDSECHKADSDIIKLLQEHSLFLNDLKPAGDDDENKASKKQ